VNAIVKLCDAVKTAASITDYAAGLTVNVGYISGGTVLNRVPHEAIAELEVRAYETCAMQRAHTALMSLAAENPVAQNARLKVECLGRTPAWPASEPTNRVFSYWGDAALQLGLRVVATSRGGLSDANYLCELGPTLDGLGPSGANAHCSESSPDGSKLPEYVDVDSFVPKAAMNVLALSQLLTSR
jgi:glutamate carboxypeptidase